MAATASPLVQAAPTTTSTLSSSTKTSSAGADVPVAAVEAQAEAEAAADDDEAADVGAAGTGAVVDMDVFEQLLEIDDDETHEFSKTLAFDYISQAETTFTEFEDALKAKDLDSLSRKGHFLKGSSAALGLQRVQHSCESMQHFGNRKDENGEGPQLSEEEALKRCRVLLLRLRKEQDEAKEWLEKFYKV